LRLNLSYEKGKTVLQSSGGLPDTGVALFDRLIGDTDLFKRWAGNLRERGYTVVKEKLPKGDAANIVKKTVTVDHAQFRYIDLLHESRHIGQIERAARQGVTSRSKAIRAVFERGAYEYELRLGRKFGFSDEYMAWLEKRVKDHWTKSVARKYSFSKRLQNLWR